MKELDDYIRYLKSRIASLDAVLLLSEAAVYRERLREAMRVREAIKGMPQRRLFKEAVTT